MGPGSSQVIRHAHCHSFCSCELHDKKPQLQVTVSARQDDKEAANAMQEGASGCCKVNRTLFQYDDGGERLAGHDHGSCVAAHTLCQLPGSREAVAGCGSGRAGLSLASLTAYKHSSASGLLADGLPKQKHDYQRQLKAGNTCRRRLLPPVQARPSRRTARLTRYCRRTCSEATTAVRCCLATMPHAAPRGAYRAVAAMI